MTNGIKGDRKSKKKLQGAWIIIKIRGNFRTRAQGPTVIVYRPARGRPLDQGRGPASGSGPRAGLLIRARGRGPLRPPTADPTQAQKISF